MDRLARALAGDPVLSSLPHPLLVDAARAGLSSAAHAGHPERALSFATVHALDAVRELLGPVINATGVLLHTNLGRAPLVARPRTGPARYTNVELDLATGERGSRRSIAGPLLARACGAESALVVNNCAAAVMLVLAALATGREVVVSRGELVEIGGGFRIPDVLEQSGAKLVEVGTTNRTRGADYERAMSRPAADVALILSVHRSNYRIEGFTEDAPLTDLVQLGASRPVPVPVVVDVGSGLLDRATPWLADRSGRVEPLAWLAGEPAVRQTIEQGAALVMFSGDKLLGGPQAGIIVGSHELVERCARHPLARALRPGALVLDALQDTALAYLRGDGRAIPLWRMATEPTSVLRSRAEAIRDVIVGEIGADTGLGIRDGLVAVVDTDSVPGGGTLPGVTVASVGLRLDGDVGEALRGLEPPVMARVHDRATILDLRTVDPSDDAVLAKLVPKVLVPKVLR